MGNSRLQKNKAHKVRFASKSTRKVHKIASGPPGACRGSKHRQPNSQAARAVRIQRNKDIRDTKRASILAKKRANTGANSPPIILALVALLPSVDAKKVKQLFASFALEDEQSLPKDEDSMLTDAQEVNGDNATVITVPRYKTRLTVITASQEDLEACLEVAKVADAIAFVTDVGVGEGNDYIDSKGKHCLSVLKAQGLPAVIGLMMNASEAPIKKLADSKKKCMSALQAELPEGSKIFTIDAAKECEQVLRHFSENLFPSPHWRSQRPYVMAQQLEFEADPKAPDRGTLKLSGYVRGRGFSANQLVHVVGGDFQLKKIEVLEDPWPLHKGRHALKQDIMEMEDCSASEKVSHCLFPDPSLQEPLVVTNTPDSLAGEQTWPTEEEMAKAVMENKKKPKNKSLPKGTSEYQAAWILDGSDNESDDANDANGEDEQMEGLDMHEALDKDGGDESALSEDEDLRSEISFHAKSTGDFDDESQSEMMDDRDLTEEELKAEMQRLKQARAADEEFPDEVDTPLDVPARQRFARFRGLKSFRTSSWDPKESLPADYGKIFAFDNFQRTQRHVLSKAKEDDILVATSVSLGTYVCLHIKDVPSSSALDLSITYQNGPVIACGLLQHESKVSVLHFSIRKHESYKEIVKSKDALIFHTGFRRYKTRPIFSTDDLNMDKHKFERFLHPGRFSIASVFAPISFPPLPLLVFKESAKGEVRNIVATGSLKSVDPDRIILKKIVLTGYPQKVSKQRAVVRFMFHNPEDVRWFKPVELWTKYGRRGRIKEPVGTHGSMKCVFDGIPQQRDTVCVSLYKRVYPKFPDL